MYCVKLLEGDVFPVGAKIVGRSLLLEVVHASLTVIQEREREKLAGH